MIVVLALTTIPLQLTQATTTPTYTLTFKENGLPHNASWNITIGNTTYESWTNQIIYKGYGNISYKINAPEYFSSNITSGFLNLTENTTINISFTPKYTGILFIEYNLPINMSWEVILGNHTLNTTTTYIYFANITGTYNYSAIPSSNIYKTIDGRISYENLTIIYLNFTKAIYEVIFISTGLSKYQPITVTLNNQTKTGTYVIFYLTNGTYNYSVAQIPGYLTSSAKGSISVSGTTVEVIQFRVNETLYRQNQNEIISLFIIASGIFAFVIYLAKGRRRVR
jgi:hypothetical protein